MEGPIVPHCSNKTTRDTLYGMICIKYYEASMKCETFPTKNLHFGLEPYA